VIVNKLNPDERDNRFFLYSALTTGLFLANEIYRIHIIFLMIDVPKLLTISVFAVVLSLYLLNCWRWIRKTNYLSLTIGLLLLAIAIYIDSVHLKNSVVASIAEGVPKLLSGFNLALYFWQVSLDKIVNRNN
jgi:hypothetical protein